LDPNIASRIDTLVAEAEAILAELSRVKSSQKPSKAGVGLFATLVVPPGYKRLARSVGSLYLDSSYRAHMARLEGIQKEWEQRVLTFLGSVYAPPTPAQRRVNPGVLQAKFRQTQRYQRVESRLRRATTFLLGLKDRGLAPYIESREGRPSPRPSPEARMLSRVAAAPTLDFLPPSVVKKLPEPVRKTIVQAQESYRMGLYEPCAVMLRKAIQNAIVLRFQAEGVEGLVLLPNGDALPLPKLIDKAQESRLISSHQAKELMRVKWLGDTAAHAYANTVTREDVDSVLLVVRLALERIFTTPIRIVMRR